MIDNALIERFWNKVSVDAPSKCWEWKGTKSPRGYGAIRVQRKMISAHRFSWMINKGNIPDKLHVLHKCDNPSCVNPAHLFTGTHTDNMHDMRDKGRLVTKCGQENGNSKLKLSQVEKIRKLYATSKYTLAALGRMFSVSYVTIRHIVRREQWNG